MRRGCPGSLGEQLALLGTQEGALEAGQGGKNPSGAEGLSFPIKSQARVLVQEDPKPQSETSMGTGRFWPETLVPCTPFPRCPSQSPGFSPHAWTGLGRRRAHAAPSKSLPRVEARGSGTFVVTDSAAPSFQNQRDVDS